MLSRNKLKLLSNKIVKLINTDKITLFGSYASGKSDEERIYFHSVSALLFNSLLTSFIKRGSLALSV
ncbi:hypothetical protein [Orenia marismortui]|uniref:hypothetical protein n=1 Tax=Orenia marismortui TaxID=46469 RepID=UPI0003818C6D|nr:hypothetical protein [Orenia marismortui]